jgi:hypothetical protein
LKIIYINTNRLILLSKPTETFFKSSIVIATGILGISGTQYKPTEDILIQYGGGPNSILGFGKTKIKYATKNDGNKLTVFDSKNSSNLVNANGARYKTWDYSLINSQQLNLDGEYEINQDFRQTIIDISLKRCIYIISILFP